MLINHHTNFVTFVTFPLKNVLRYLTAIAGDPDEGNEFCAGISPAGKWGDRPCIQNNPFICERTRGE